jgi:hypothetical protein
VKRAGLVEEGEHRGLAQSGRGRVKPGVIFQAATKAGHARQGSRT